MNIHELVDIVSEDDVVIGTMLRGQVFEQKLTCIRAINAFMVNDKGQLWIPRRTASKVLFPLHLDSSVGGQVLAGESYLDACIRETVEEVGLVVTEKDLKVLGRLTPHGHGAAVFMYVYQINSNATPAYNTDDFVESYWVYPHEVLQRLEAGDCAKSDLPIMIRHIYT